MERDESTVFSAMMVEVWMTKGEMGDEDENDMERNQLYDLPDWA